MTERRVSLTDGLAERVVRRAIASLANSYPDADGVDGYAAAAALAALARGVEAEAGEGLDWLSVAALDEWDFHHPENPI
jgi:hypothetical protein